MTRRIDSRLIAAFLVAPVLAAVLGSVVTPRVIGRGLPLVVALVLGVHEATRVSRTVKRAVGVAGRLAEGDQLARMQESGPAWVRSLAAALNAVAASNLRRDEQLTAALEDAANQRDLFYSIVNASSDGLLFYDEHRRPTAANPRCAELLGFSLTQLLNTDALVLQQSLEARCASPTLYRPMLEAHFARPDQAHEDHLTVLEPCRRVLRRTSCAVMRHGRVAGRVFTYTDLTSEMDRMATRDEQRAPSPEAATA